MVTEWVLQVFGSVVSSLLGLVHVPPPPAVLSDTAGVWSSIAGYVQGTGVWLPWGLVVVLLGAWAVSMGAMVTIKGVRIVASFLTLGGGSAA